MCRAVLCCCAVCCAVCVIAVCRVALCSVCAVSRLCVVVGWVVLLSSSVDIAIVPSVCVLVVLLRVFGVWFLYCLWAGCGRCVAAGHHCGVRGPYTPVAWPMRLSVAPGKWPALSVPSVAPGLRPPPPGLSRGCSPARCWGCWWPSNSRRRIRPLASGPPVPTGPCPPVRPDIRTQARPLDSPLLHVACDKSRSPSLAVAAP